MKSQSVASVRSASAATRKLVLTGMLACLAFVLNTFVYFPAMVTGAIFGPILGGLLYRRFKSFWAAFLGEVIGTGLCGALASYPLMKLFYGLDAQSPFYYIPFYTPSAVVGGLMGVAVLFLLARAGLLKRMQQELGN